MINEQIAAILANIFIFARVFERTPLETNASSVMQTKREKINNRMSVITEKYLRKITVKTFKQSENKEQHA